MSLEESMKELAESNTKLAKALNRYADVIEENGVGVVSQAKGKAKPAEDEEAAAPKGKAKPASTAKGKAKPAEDEDDEDDDGLEEAPPAAKGKGKAKAITFDQVKAELLKVKELGGREAASEIFNGYGYSSLNNVQEKDYQAIYNDAVKYIEENEE